MRLAPCSSCGRHVRIGDSVCVFCASPRAIAGVALVVAIGAGAAVGCAENAYTPSPNAAVYGGPPPGPDDRDVDGGALMPPSPSTSAPQPTAPPQPTTSAPFDPTRAAPAYGAAPPPNRK